VLAEARQLGAELGLGGAAPDPLTAAEMALHQLGGRFEAAPPADEPDPDAAQPYPLDHDAVAAIGTFLASKFGPETARDLGAKGIGHAAAAIGALPRELASLLDNEGFFGSEQSWGLLAAIGTNAAGHADADPIHLDLPELSAHARRYGLADDVESVSNVGILLKALPARLRAGISEAMTRDPDVWALAAHMGAKLWGHIPTRAVRRSI
jgi:hypothetical protein